MSLLRVSTRAWTLYSNKHEKSLSWPLFKWYGAMVNVGQNVYKVSNLICLMWCTGTKDALKGNAISVSSHTMTYAMTYANDAANSVLRLNFALID